MFEPLVAILTVGDTLNSKYFHFTTFTSLFKPHLMMSEWELFHANQNP